MSWIRKGIHTPTKSTTTEHQESNTARDDQGDTHLHDKRRAPSRPTDVQHNKIKHRAETIKHGKLDCQRTFQRTHISVLQPQKWRPESVPRAQVKRGDTLHLVKMGHQTRLSRGGAQRTKHKGEAYITRGGKTIKGRTTLDIHCKEEGYTTEQRRVRQPRRHTRARGGIHNRDRPTSKAKPRANEHQVRQAPIETKPRARPSPEQAEPSPEQGEPTSKTNPRARRTHEQDEPTSKTNPRARRTHEHEVKHIPRGGIRLHIPQTHTHPHTQAGKNTESRGVIQTKRRSIQYNTKDTNLRGGTYMEEDGHTILPRGGKLPRPNTPNSQDLDTESRSTIFSKVKVSIQANKSNPIKVKISIQTNKRESLKSKSRHRVKKRYPPSQNLDTKSRITISSRSQRLSNPGKIPLSLKTRYI